MLDWILISLVVLLICGFIGWKIDEVEGCVSLSTVAIIAIFLAWMAALAIIDSKVNAQCQASGWRSGHFNIISGVSYCVTRSDQTDIIRPLDEALRNPR